MVSFLGSVILLALAFGFSESDLAKNFTKLTQKCHASGTINCQKKNTMKSQHLLSTYSLNISKNNIFYSFSHIFFFVYDNE